MKNSGFTLAEVLLTLTIIGVVAALTIPAVITKVTKDQYVVALKKAYNTLKPVEREAVQENGPIATWNWTNGNTLSIFTTYLKPHFDILKDCGWDNDEGCFVNSYKVLKGENENVGGMNMFGTYKIVTSDGISYGFTKMPLSANYKAWFWVDVNGRKGPNRTGRDMFRFDLFQNIGIKPEGAYNSNGLTVISSEYVNAYCNDPSTGSGLYCATKVLSEGAMNY